ncbi:amino acid adenylation domain-containing protein [Streptomyces sp. NPDC047974]|uniref:amino acid adenylation domain-containing protein n=1 Tax=Streptomyces sp. NPDC047974 TaxID=3154343 RepID=UPI0033FD0792
MAGSTSAARGAILRGPVRDRPAPSGVPGLIRDVSTARPDAVALVDGQGAVTYAELETASDTVARRLVEAGGRPGDVVAVCVPRGRHLVFALLGALKAGMPYLPLAPEDPEERRARLLRSSRAGLVLVAGRSADGPGPWQDAGARVLRVDTPASPHGAVPPERWLPLRQVADDHPAYVLYTSGSTGEPKGVVVPSLALCNRLVWMRETYGFAPGDRVLQKTPATFDVSGWEFFGPLVSGATEVLMAPEAHRDPGEVIDCVRGHRVTVCHFVPSMLEEFLRWPGADRCDSLRAVMCSGEALTPGLVRRFRSVLDADLHNLYGPTEAAIDVTAWECPRHAEDLETVLIGGPIDNCTLVVLDDEMRPVAEGDVGQLAIGGLPLALGYLHRPDLTDASFVDAPDWCPVPRLYLTGDLVRRHGDALEYLGRKDHQVKIRGQRVELRETEDVLRDLDTVRDAAVVAAPGPDGALVVCAFIVPAPGTTVDEELSRAVRERAARALPEAFVPTLVLGAESLPLTSSGKQDQRALKARAQERLAGLSGPVPETASDELAGFWQEAVGGGDGAAGFLDAGGHSLAAARLAGRILGRWAVRLPLSVFLRDNVSLEGLRARIPETPPPRSPKRAVRASGDTLPVSPEQRRLWLWQQVHPRSPAYNVVGVLHVAGRIDPAALREACADLVARHESLRTVVEPSPSGALSQRVMPPSGPPSFTERVIGGDDPAAVRAFVDEVAGIPFPAERLPRLAVGLLHCEGDGPGPRTSRLVLSVDHLFSDQRSLDLLQRDLAGLYAARVAGTEAELPPVVQFRDALAVEPVESEGPAARKALDLAFWSERLAGAPQRLDLPHRKPRPGLPGHRGAEAVVDLERRTSLELDRVCREERVTVATLFLSAYARVLAAWSARASVVVGVPMSGRETDEQHEAVGFFMRTAPVRLDVPSGADTREVLSSVAEAVVTASEHLAPTFEEIVARMAVDRSPDTHPLFQVWFNDLTQAAPPTGFAGLPAVPEEPETHWSLFDLGLYLSRRPDGGYRLRLAYAEDFWDAETAQDFLAGCRDAVLSLPTPAPPAPASVSEPPPPLEPSPVRRTCADLVRAVLSRAESTPRRPALVSGGSTVTYGALASRVRRVGALVRTRTEPGRPVAVLARRDAGLAAAVLGSWHAGRPVLLVDAEAPAAWRDRVLSTADVSLVLTTDASAVPGFACEQVDGPAVSEGEPSPVQEEFAPDSPGHLLVTSGTSGRPAVVVLPADALPEALDWYGRELGLGGDDVFCLSTPPAHDPVLRSLLLPLTLGASVHVPRPGQAERPEELLDLLEHSGTTVLHLTPSQATILAAFAGERTLPDLRSVVFHGEPLHGTCAERTSVLAPGAGLFNLYGSTETPQASSLHRWSRTARSATAGARGGVPIGRGVPHRHLDVVSPAGRPALTGEAGELVVTGRGLALGYLGDPGRLAGPAPVADGVRRYATGDLARRDRHGVVTILGRTDRRISLGGYRIELDEVEGAIARLRGVQRCAVATDPARPDSLIAWVVGEQLGTDDELGAALARLVPRWQQPSRWIRVPGLPSTPNGKADIAALLRQAAEERADRSTDVAALPAEELTRLIVDRARALCPDGELLTADTVFFDAGMVSMTLFRLFHTLTTADGLGLTLADVFRFPTPRSLAAHLGSGAPSPAVAPSPRRPASAASAASAAAERAARRAARRALPRSGRASVDETAATPHRMKRTPNHEQ